MRRLYSRLASFIFYFGLDVLVGAIAYAVSREEIDLTRGQLMIRMMTAIVLANGIVGGPDVMLFWKESGRRISAEERLETTAQERDVATQERDVATQERDAERDARIAAEQERDAAIANAAAMTQRLDELSTQVEQLQNDRAARRPRRRRLRNRGR